MFTRAIILLAFLALLSGCETADSITIPRAPAWIQPDDTREFNALQVLTEARAVAPKAAISYSDDSYTLVSKEWLDRYTSWTWSAAMAIGLRYTKNSFDCENFAGLFMEIASKKAADGNVFAAPLVARITVSAPGNQRHSMVGVATDRGIFIIEPQFDAGPFRIRPLAEFKEVILGIELGAFNPP